MPAPKGLYPSEFYGRAKFRYRATGEFRPPKKGEFYLSGAIITAYRAPNDLSSPFWIAVPVNVNMVPCKHCNGVGAVLEEVKRG